MRRTLCFHCRGTSSIPIRELRPQMLLRVAPSPSPNPLPNSIWLRNILTVCTSGENQRRNQTVWDEGKTARRGKSKACSCQREWEGKEHSLQDRGLSQDDPSRGSCQSPRLRRGAVCSGLSPASPSRTHFSDSGRNFHFRLKCSLPTDHHPAKAEWVLYFLTTYNCWDPMSVHKSKI